VISVGVRRVNWPIGESINRTQTSTMNKPTVTPNALWRIHLRPATSGAETANEFCFNEKIVGFGWPIKSQPGVPFTSVSNYLAAAEDHYVANWNLHGEPRKNKGFRKAMSALTGKGKMRINDLVWTRTRAGIYYLGRITGNWKYAVNDENIAADIVNFRDCEWVEIGGEDRVMGLIVNRFIAGATLQQVHSYPALDFSIKVWNEAAQEGRGEARLSHTTNYDPTADLFDKLSSQDCEDVVGLYLQLDRDYLIVPGTCKKGTQRFEFVLINKNDGHRAMAQVKQGKKDILRATDYSDLAAKGYKVYLWSSKQQYGDLAVAAGVEYLCTYKKGETDPLESFVRENESLMPERIRTWL
jgi:hypothetical protein